jgi:hypothetical protein
MFSNDANRFGGVFVAGALFFLLSFAPIDRVTLRADRFAIVNLEGDFFLDWAIFNNFSKRVSCIFLLGDNRTDVFIDRVGVVVHPSKLVLYKETKNIYTKSENVRFVGRMVHVDIHRPIEHMHRLFVHVLRNAVPFEKEQRQGGVRLLMRHVQHSKLFDRCGRYQRFLCSVKRVSAHRTGVPAVRDPFSDTRRVERVIALQNVVSVGGTTRFETDRARRTHLVVLPVTSGYVSPAKQRIRLLVIDGASIPARLVRPWVDVSATHGS